jgi:phosphoserine phosphatase
MTDPFAPVPHDHPVLAELEAHPPGDAVFDLDGTLILHDIGEAVLKLRLADGPLPPTARAVLGVTDPWGAYEALDPIPQAVVAVQALAGLTVADCERLVDVAFAEGMVAPNAPVCALAASIARRHRVWILTGSAEVLGRACAPRLGVRHVVGLRQHEEHGVLTDRVIAPFTCAEGKPDACRAWICERPVFAIGDSPWDEHILGMAAVARTTGRWAGKGFPAYP